MPVPIIPSNLDSPNIIVCWQAATNEKFKKNKIIIQKLNVPDICQEILQTLQNEDEANKFNLYMYSQLMYGVTKIHRYQTEYNEKELFESTLKLIEKTENQKELIEPLEEIRDFNAFDLQDDFVLPEQPRIHDYQIRSDIHLLPDELDYGLQTMIPDTANFGPISDDELTFWVRHTNDNTFEQEKMHITDDNRQQNTTEKTVDADREIIEEVQRMMLSPKTRQSSVIVDISKKIDEKKLLSTPQKRQSHQQHVETPSKRKRLQFEDNSMAVVPPPLDNAEMLFPELSAQKTPLVPHILLPAENMIETVSLQSVDTEMMMNLDPVLPRHDTDVTKKKKFIDKNTILSDNAMRWLQNINAHCKPMILPRTSLIPADVYFQRPSLRPTQWGAPLRKLFNNHIIGPFVSAKESNIDTFMKSREEIRARQETLNEYTGKTMSKMLDTNEQLPVEETFDAMRTLCISEKEPQDREQQKTNMNVSAEGDSLLDVDIFLKQRNQQNKCTDTVLSSPTRSSEKSQDRHSLTSQEIMAMLEVLWCNKEHAEFSEIISKETYTKEDAAETFRILLEFHEQRKVILQQVDFYRDLWIRKYEGYMG